MNNSAHTSSRCGSHHLWDNAKWAEQICPDVCCLKPSPCTRDARQEGFAHRGGKALKVPAICLWVGCPQNCLGLMGGMIGGVSYLKEALCVVKKVGGLFLLPSSWSHQEQVLELLRFGNKAETPWGSDSLRVKAKKYHSGKGMCMCGG